MSVRGLLMVRRPGEIYEETSFLDVTGESPDPQPRAAELEIFRQANENARAFMDLRFKHFGTFVLTAIALAGAGLRIEDLQGKEGVVSLAGAALTVCFWALDRRTGAYLTAHANQAADYARRLGADAAKPASGGVGSSTLTALLFAAITLAWLASALDAVT